MYAMLCTRLDVNLAVSLVGRYQSNPGMEHWPAVKNILKYLKRTKDMFLVDHWTAVKNIVKYLKRTKVCFIFMEVTKSFSEMVTSMKALTLIRMTLSHKPDTCFY